MKIEIPSWIYVQTLAGGFLTNWILEVFGKKLQNRLSFLRRWHSTHSAFRLRVSNLQSCVIFHTSNRIYLGQCNQYWAAGFAQDPSSGAERCRGNSKNEVGFLDTLFEKVTTWECLKTKSTPESGGTPLISFPSKPIPNKSCHHAYMLLFYAGFIDCKLIHMIKNHHIHMSSDVFSIESFNTHALKYQDPNDPVDSRGSQLWPPQARWLHFAKGLRTSQLEGSVVWFWGLKHDENIIYIYTYIIYNNIYIYIYIYIYIIWYICIYIDSYI